ncbi:MAG: LacI family DNA-binding transcriptional regulator [Pseudomonadota bacterium]
MRPTVNDIAREAGVSLATVDRVLNERPGVRPRTVQVVTEAIARIGYVRDLAAANLARGRSYRIACLLPDTESQFLATVEQAIHDAAAAAVVSRTEVETLRFPAEDPHALVAILAGLQAQGISGVAIMAPETPHLRDAIRSLRHAGVAVVALVSDLPNTGRDHFIGIDNVTAGRTAGVLMGRFLSGNPGQIMVVAQSLLSRDALERRRGFDAVVQADFPGLEVLQTLEAHGSPDILRRAVFEMSRHAPQLRGVYVLGSGHRVIGAALADLGLARRVVVIGHEMTPHTRNALQSGTIDALVTQNTGHLARSALRVLRARIDRVPIDEGQEQIRIDIVLRENLPPMAEDPGQTPRAKPDEAA